MDKSRNRLSLILAGGAACTLTFAPAVGQQSTPQQTALQPILPILNVGNPTTRSPLSGIQITGNQATPAGIGIGTGLSVTLDFSSTFRYDDNLGDDDPSLGSTSWWENSLGFGVVNQTPDSLLVFNASGLHRYADQPNFGTSSDFTDPSVNLSYSRDAANSRFSIQGSYRERDLNFSQSLTDINQDGVIDAVDLSADFGTRINTQYGLTWQTGVNDPLGFIFSYNRSEQEYENTVDPNLFDTQRNIYVLTSLLRISPVVQGNVTLRYVDYSAEDTDRTDRQTTILSTGITYDVSPVTTVTADIGYSQVDETLRAIPLNTDDEDLVASASWTRTLPNGTANAFVDRAFGTNGDRTTVQAGRTFTLQNGTFAVNAGISRGPFGDNTPIADMAYVHNLSTSQITASLRRRVGTSNQSIETRETVARLGYDYTINPLSSLSFGINYAEQEDEGIGPSNRRRRTDFNASYTRALTKDWNMTVGYQHRIRNDSGPGSSDSNSISFTLGRQFTLKP